MWPFLVSPHLGVAVTPEERESQSSTILSPRAGLLCVTRVPCSGEPTSPKRQDHFRDYVSFFCLWASISEKATSAKPSGLYRLETPDHFSVRVLKNPMYPHISRLWLTFSHAGKRDRYIAQASVCGTDTPPYGRTPLLHISTVSELSPGHRLVVTLMCLFHSAPAESCYGGPEAAMMLVSLHLNRAWGVWKAVGFSEKKSCFMDFFVLGVENVRHPPLFPAQKEIFFFLSSLFGTTEFLTQYRTECKLRPCFSQIRFAFTVHPSSSTMRPAWDRLLEAQPCPRRLWE